MSNWEKLQTRKQAFYNPEALAERKTVSLTELWYSING
jgi:hypothetical protein